MNHLKKPLAQYISAYAGCLQFMAGDALGWDNRETGGPLYGLFTHARRPVVMLAAPGGPNTCHEGAHFAMDHEYVTKLNRYVQTNFGIQCLGDWHSHHDLGMDHASGGDVNHIHRLAGRSNIDTMVQLVLTHERAAVPDQQVIESRGPVQKFLDKAISTVARTDSVKNNHEVMGRDPLAIRINAFIYTDAAKGPYSRCPVKILPGRSPIRSVLADSEFLNVRGRRQFEDLPLERILYDTMESHAEPGSTEPCIPNVLVKHLRALPDEIVRETEVYACQEGILLSLPLRNSHRLSIAYAVEESPPGIRSVTAVFPDTKTAIDLTKEVLMDDDRTPLSIIYKRAEGKVEGAKMTRVPSSITCGDRPSASESYTKQGNPISAYTNS